MVILLLALLLTILAFALPAMRNCNGWGNPDSHTIKQGKQPRNSKGHFVAYPPLAPLQPVHAYIAVVYATVLLVAITLTHRIYRS